jgi:hypothetical protein
MKNQWQSKLTNLQLSQGDKVEVTIKYDAKTLENPSIIVSKTIMREVTPLFKSALWVIRSYIFAHGTGFHTEIQGMEKEAFPEIFND